MRPVHVLHLIVVRTGYDSRTDTGPPQVAKEIFHSGHIVVGHVPFKVLQFAGYFALHVIASGKPSVENLHKRLSLYHVLKMLHFGMVRLPFHTPKE